MLFVKATDLKKGMRLAKPIYNKKGVLLYGRDTKLTKQGINSIKNFELIGIYILEPAEPLPPMTDEDIEFERFQTMAVFNIKEDMQLIINREEPQNLNRLARLIVDSYGKNSKRVNFTQNLRSPSDYIYKHSLNVAILAALITNKLKIKESEQIDIVASALLYDLGKLLVSESLACIDEPDEEGIELIKKSIVEGYNLLEYINISQSIKGIISQVQREIYRLGANAYAGKDKIIINGTRAIMVADYYDRLTAMKIDENPMSEIAVVRKLINNDFFDEDSVTALFNSINIVVPGVCLELTNGEKGLVIAENQEDILKPVVLGFTTNEVYNLAIDKKIQIRDVMKTMDNRIIIDRELLKEYS